MAISHRAGEFIALSDGEYSDYCFRGLYRVLVDLDLTELTDGFIPYLRARALLEGKDTTVPDDDDFELEHTLGMSTDAFGAYLIYLGKVEPVDYDEIHTGYRFKVKEVREWGARRAEQLSRKEDSTTTPS